MVIQYEARKRPFNLIRAEFLFIFYGSFVYGCKTLHCENVLQQDFFAVVEYTQSKFD